MDISVKNGDFKRMGVCSEKDRVTLTFETQTDDPVSILLFKKTGKKLIKEIFLDDTYRQGRLYSVSIFGIDTKDTAYLLKINGKEEETDPYAPVIYGREKWADKKRSKKGYKVYGGFAPAQFDWKGDRCPELPAEDLIIYKVHMRGLTMGAPIKAELKGNYLGVRQRISDIKNMGFTAIEFMPLYDFEELRYRMKSEMIPGKHMRLVPDEPYGVNYWGYGKAFYFAPKASYFGGEDPVTNMKETVREIHKNGIEVIMLMSFDPAFSENDIINCLNFWVREYHVDGFHLVGSGLPMERIAREPSLGSTKIFSDDFNNNVLSFESRYSKKHLFRYDSGLMYPLRKLQNHMDGSIIDFANMMKRQASSYGYVNFAANNNGFTLMDVYSYSEKHNLDNGEGNRDGENYNFSHNYGYEGETTNKSIINQRYRRVRLALAATLLSQGIPLVLSGDETGNSQNGNNNAYCQDNETGWVNYNRKKQPKQLKKYTEELIKFRKAHTVLSLKDPVEMTDYKHLGVPDLSYHGTEPWTMWLSEDQKKIGIMYYHRYARNENEEDVMLCFNFYFVDESFALPKLPDRRKWFFVSNTNDDEWTPSEEPLTEQNSIQVPGGSLTILVGKTVPRRRKAKNESNKASSNDKQS